MKINPNKSLLKFSIEKPTMASSIGASQPVTLGPYILTELLLTFLQTGSPILSIMSINPEIYIYWASSQIFVEDP